MIPYKVIAQYRLLQKDSLLYHGTGVDFNPEKIEAPVWLSNSIEVAKYFSTYNQEAGIPRVLKFRLEETIPVVLIPGREIYSDICEMYGVEDQLDLAKLMSIGGYNGWIIPDNYPNGDDILVTDRAIKYLNFVEQVPEKIYQ